MDKDEPSLRETLESSFDTDSKAPEPAASHEPIVPSAPDKFASDPEPARDPAVPGADAQATDPAAPANAAAAPKPAKMPPGFPDVNVWQGLPDVAKAAFVERERKSNELLRNNAGKSKFADAIIAEMRPYEWMLQAKGVPPAQVIRETMQMNAVLSGGTPAEKHAMFARMAQHYGISVQALQDPSLAPKAEQVNPQVQRLQQELAEMRQYLGNGVQQQARHEAQQAWTAVEQMANDSKYQHLDVVNNDMADLIESGKANTLDEAYQKAMWMRPDTRALLLTEEAANRAKAARAAAAESTAHGGSAIAGSTKPQSGSLRATLERAFAAA